MCTENQLQLITREVARFASETLQNSLDSVILYGSYARGDYDEQSDIDIMILAHITPEQCWQYTNTIAEKMTDLELKYDIVISVHVVSSDVFHRYVNVLPFYGNVNREGIRIAV